MTFVPASAMLLNWAVESLWQAQQVKPLRHPSADGVCKEEVAAGIELVGGDGNPIRNWQSEIRGSKESEGAVGDTAGTAEDEIGAGQAHLRELWTGDGGYLQRTIEKQLVGPGQTRGERRQNQGGESARIAAGFEQLKAITEIGRIRPDIGHGQNATIIQRRTH